jgi:hypothetical protein
VPRSSTQKKAPRLQWNPDADCDGGRAVEHVIWLMQNCGLSMEDAKERIMEEYDIIPWDADADCDGIRAAERVHEVMQQDGTPEAVARKIVSVKFGILVGSGEKERHVWGVVRDDLISHLMEVLS